MNAKRATLVTAGVILAIVGSLPLCLMIWSSFRVDDGFSLGNYVEVLGNAGTWKLFRNSLLLASLTTAVAGMTGIALGLLVAKTDFPFARTFVAIFALPLLFPPYILAVGWFEILGRQGILSHWLGQAIAETTSHWLFGMPGAVLVLTSAFLPIVLLLTIIYANSLNPSFEEAGRLSGSWPVVIRRITIPLIMPGVLLSLVLVFLLTIGEFGAPAFLRLNVFPVASFTQSSAFYNFGAATSASMPLILVVLAGVIVVECVLRGKQYSFRWGGRPALAQIELGRWKLIVFSVVFTLAVVLIGIPIGGVLWRSSSVNALIDAFDRAGDSAIRSILYAGLSATALTVLGFFLAYLIHRRALAAWWLCDSLSLFLFTLPGTVLGIGLIALWNHRSTNWIYATPVILMAGFTAQYAALGSRILAAGLSQVSPSLEEAAEVAGVEWFQRVFGILAPVVGTALLASWSVGFVFCLRDVSLPLLLAPPGGDTLTARTMTLMANGSPELIAALCLMAIFVAMLPLGIFWAAWYAWSRPA